MKFDALTLAAVMFLVGLALNSLSLPDAFTNAAEPPAELQQAIVRR